MQQNELVKEQKSEVLEAPFLKSEEFFLTLSNRTEFRLMGKCKADLITSGPKWLNLCHGKIDTDHKLQKLLS